MTKVCADSTSASIPSVWRLLPVRGAPPGLGLVLLICLIPMCGSHMMKGGNVKGGQVNDDSGTLYEAQSRVLHSQGQFSLDSQGRLFEAGDKEHIFLVEESIEDDLRDEQLRETKMRPVPISLVRQKMHNVHTFHDVLRIFYGYDDDSARWSNDMIESAFMHRQLPRMAHTMATGTSFGGVPLSEGRALENFMLGDAPCEKCEIIAGLSPPGKSPSHKRRLRQQRQRRRRNRERERSKKAGARKRANRDRKPKKKNRKKKKKGKGMKAMRRATRHVKDVMGRTYCAQPVPVCVNAREISTSANKMYFPECTIVYQCRKDSGCCPGGEACAPVENDTIRRYFWETEMKPGDRVQLQPTASPIQWFSFLNHTRCGCRPVKILPQCLTCPHPYVRVDVNVTQCVCDCPTSHRHKTCEKIKRGHAPLMAPQLQCIKENRCHLPRCRHGDFDIAEGYCPLRSSSGGGGSGVKSSREISQQTVVNRAPSFSPRIGYSQSLVGG